MRDYNFFAPYMQTKRKKADISMFIIALLCIGMVGLLALSGIIFMNLNSKKAELDSLKTAMEDPKYKASQTEAKQLMDEKSQLSMEKDFFWKLQGAMTEVHRVNEEFMKFLAAETIKDLYIANINITDREIQIQGASSSKQNIAQFERDLRATGTFEDLTVTQIAKEEKDENAVEPGTDMYSFQMVIHSKPGEHTSSQMEALLKDDEDMPGAAPTEETPATGEKTEEPAQPTETPAQ